MKYNQGVDEWFNEVRCSPFHNNPQVKRLDAIAQLQPSRRSFDKFVNVLGTVTVPWDKALKTFTDNMQAGAFKSEFRFFANGRWGSSSQVSELFSLFRQALHYNS